MPASRCEVMPARGTSGSGEYSVCLSLSRQRAVRNPERPRCSSNTPPTSLRLSCFIAARAACRSSDESRWADLSPVSGPTSKYDYLDFGRPSVHAIVGRLAAIGRSSRSSRWFFSPAAPVNRCVRRDDDGGHARISKWLVHGRSTTALRLPVIFSALSLDFTSLAASLGSLRVRLYRLLRRLGICSVTSARIIRLHRLRPRVHSLDLAADGPRSLESTSLACNILRLPLGIRHPNQSQSSARPRVQVLGGRRACSVLWLPIPVASRLGSQTDGRMTARRRS